MREFLVIASVSLVLMTSCITAAPEIFEGELGEIKWKLTEGVLTIRGTGEMPDFNFGTPPWKSRFYEEKIKLEKIVIADGVTSIGKYAFAGLQNLKMIKIAESVKKIGYASFEYSGLDAIKIPATIDAIDDWAFTKASIQVIVFEGPVASMGKNIFTAYAYVPICCIIEMKCPPFSVRKEFFVDFDKEKSYLYVPQGTKALYETAEGWREFKNIIEK